MMTRPGGTGWLSAFLCAGLGAWLGGDGGWAAETAIPPAPLQSAPVNTWVKVLEMKTGARAQPIFVYAAKAGKFVAAAGIQQNSGDGPRHYDTEELELALTQWINAYPPGMEKGRPISGPVGDEYSKQRAKQGYNGRDFFYKDGDYLRIGAGSQWHDGKTYGEYCYVPEGGTGGTIYAYMWNKTICYDVAARTWKDLEAKPREKCRIWGSLCYDPVNREILHAGGDGGTADTSTWVYSIEKNEWRKLDFGSARIKEFQARAQALSWQAKELVGRCASRHAVAETVPESKVDLPGEGTKLAASAQTFAGEVAAAGLSGSEKMAGEVAVRRLNDAAAAVKIAGPTLGDPITPGKIAAVRAARAIFEQVVDALAVEPPGRARSQVAFDAVHNRIVLFGGDGLDRVLSDTWVYDCQTRTWEQKFPAKSPAPRAGHILGWLPGARRIVMAGGYSRVPLAQDVWTYDVGTNEWKPLLHAPLAGGLSPDAPNINAREYQVGAVADGDVIVCVQGTAGRSQTTWACKADPAAPAAGAAAAATVAPGSYVFNTLEPATWEKVAKPDPAAARQVFAEMPVNQWTALTFPKYAPGANNRWGTTAYDTDRHQFLFWGGGHATSHDNDVGHFSVLGSFWTIGYTPDDPIENVYANQPTPLSFHDRCHVPLHAYKAYAYDPTAGKMFYFDRAYDPLVRDWVSAPLPGLAQDGPMHSHMKATAAGAVTFSSKGLFRFDNQAGRWVKLPWTGTQLDGIYCDGPCMVYDSKRDCLWIANDKGIYKYDFATGVCEKSAAATPKPLGAWPLPGEAVYLPDADLILAMCPVKRADGKVVNYVWDPKDSKFYWAGLTFSDHGKDVEFKDVPFGWSDALAYDPELKLVLLNNSAASRVWALKFDRKVAALTPLAE